MKMSQMFITTLKEVPAEAETISHQLMLRAGLIRKVASGIYNYYPLGYKVIRKIEDIARSVFDEIGAHELLMPALHPIELWNETGRNADMGENMFRLKDRSGREFCLGMTHEEIITDIARREIKSYKQLPVALYQIQTKFRDEPRPRAGVIRAREFIMKDLYSFHADWECLDKYYEKVYGAYVKMFKSCGLRTRAVLADSGPMGGDVCHEFMIESEAGEDRLFICQKCDTGYSEAVAKYYREDVDIAGARQGTPLRELQEVHTPNVKTIDELVKFLGRQSKDFIKAIIYKTSGGPLMALVRGDHDVNEVLLRAALKNVGAKGASPLLDMASAEEIEKLTGAPMGFSGPAGIKNLKIIADKDIKRAVNAVVGANKKDTHFINANIDRDFKVDIWADIRVAQEGDLCVSCKEPLELKKGVELGHIFKLGTKYSSSMKAVFLDADGLEKPLIMGCYGIGISRIAAAVIEQYHDKDGIIWPVNLAPFKVAVIPVVSNNDQHMKLAVEVYEKIKAENIDCLIDDRDLRPGVKFKDIDLIGIPVKIIIGDKAAAENKLEVKFRKSGKTVFLAKEEIINAVKDLKDESR